MKLGEAYCFRVQHTAIHDQTASSDCAIQAMAKRLVSENEKNDGKSKTTKVLRWDDVAPESLSATAANHARVNLNNVTNDTMWDRRKPLTSSSSNNAWLVTARAGPLDVGVPHAAPLPAALWPDRTRFRASESCLFLL